MARKKKEVTLQVTPDKSTSKTQTKVKNNNEWPRFEELDEEQLDIVLKYTQKFAHHFKTNSHKVDLNMLKKIWGGNIFPPYTLKTWKILVNNN